MRWRVQQNPDRTDFQYNLGYLPRFQRTRLRSLSPSLPIHVWRVHRTTNRNRPDSIRHVDGAAAQRRKPPGLFRRKPGWPALHVCDPSYTALPPERNNRRRPITASRGADSGFGRGFFIYRADRIMPSCPTGRATILRGLSLHPVSEFARISDGRVALPSGFVNERQYSESSSGVPLSALWDIPSRISNDTNAREFGRREERAMDVLSTDAFGKGANGNDCSGRSST